MVRDRDDVERALKARGPWYRGGLVLFGVGTLACIAGFLLAQGRTGDAATGPGVLAGAGFAVLVAGLILAAWHHPRRTRQIAEKSQTKRDRLQAERSGQLLVFPMVGLVFLILAIGPVRDILSGEDDFGDWLSVMLPVLYAWLTAAITLGWDGQSLRNRRFLEDELTVVLRARAMTAAFLVLMAGATAALVLALNWPVVGILVLMAAIAAGGATAGMRFAWLDREAGRGE